MTRKESCETLTVPLMVDRKIELRPGGQAKGVQPAGVDLKVNSHHGLTPGHSFLFFPCSLSLQGPPCKCFWLPLALLRAMGRRRVHLCLIYAKHPTYNIRKSRSIILPSEMQLMDPQLGLAGLLLMLWRERTGTLPREAPSLLEN